MKTVSANEVRSLILSSLQTQLEAIRLTADDVPDDFDLLTRGVVDSLAILELITEIEKHFDIKINFEDLEPENLMVIGPFCRYIEEKCSVGRLHAA